MDVEAELIRSQNWTELKNFYTGSDHRSWELAWLYLLKQQDAQQAATYFKRSMRDPRYDEASMLMLWKLKALPSASPLKAPPSLQLYLARERGQLRPLIDYLSRSSTHRRYASSLLLPVIEKASESDLKLLSTLSKPVSVTAALYVQAETKLRSKAFAAFYAQEFLNDAWVKKIVDELNRHVFDSESMKRLQSLYRDRDVPALAQELRAVEIRIRKGIDLQEPWKSAILKAVKLDAKNLSNRESVFDFWQSSPLSLAALDSIRREVFSEESSHESPILKLWSEFANSTVQTPPSKELEPDSLPLWQIRVELDATYLSEALLRFPADERFLFLWALQKRMQPNRSKKKWPGQEQESEVVRKNLERAFDKSENPLLWFERLREYGCSQTFYEYAMSRLDIPLDWILEDLEQGHLEQSVQIRRTLVKQLSLTTKAGGSIKPENLLKAFGHLTPAETQSVLLSRYVLMDLQPEVIRDDFLDLFWDARDLVSEEVSTRWARQIVANVRDRSMQSYSPAIWRWIQQAWKQNLIELASFIPEHAPSIHFPWDTFLETLDQAKAYDLLSRSLLKLPSESARQVWAEMLVNLPTEPLHLNAVLESFNDPVRKAHLRAVWNEKNLRYAEAISERLAEWEESAVLNEQVDVARKILHLYRSAAPSGDSSTFSLEPLQKMTAFLSQSGFLTTDLCFEIVQTYLEHRLFEEGWTWALQLWSRASYAEKEQHLDLFLDVGFQSRNVDEAQRTLVEFLFRQGEPGQLTYKVLEVLLSQKSLFRLKFLRKEFVERAGQVFPLHREALKARAQFDYRGVLLWQSFYGEPLEKAADLPSVTGKRRCELWKLTESVTHVESFAAFSSYLEATHLPPEVSRPYEHPFLDQAKRLLHRAAKPYSIKLGIDVQISEEITTPFKVFFKEPAILLRPEFFDLLDDEVWGALSVGLFQLLEDRERGLFDERFLIERFFQGMLLSGAPIAKLIRLWVWLGIHESMVEPQVIQSDPEVLLHRLPFLNHLLIFYLSQDFSQKMEESALIPS